MTEPIPRIDLSAPVPHVAEQLDTACSGTGFFSIVGHGVDAEVTTRAWEAMVRFFAQPSDVKLRARHGEDPDHAYGFFPAGREALAASLGVQTPPDLKESFNLGPPGHHPDPTGRFGGVERIWPATVPGFEEAWTRYYDAMAALSERLLVLFAVALHIAPDTFTSAVDHHLSALRGLHYPPLEAPAAPGQLRAGAHSDYGTLTILRPGGGDGGLEVQLADGRWAPVRPIDGAFVVNLGDMMQRWTNDRWRSTRHRVALPPSRVASTERRYAMAFFHQPSWDAEIATVSSCIDAEHPERYEPVRAGPWLETKFTQASTGH